MQRERQGIMVRSRYGAMNLRPRCLQGTSQQHPIDRRPSCEGARAGCCLVFNPERILKLHVSNGRCRGALGDIEIEVASEHDRRIGAVLARIPQKLYELRMANILATTFQV